MMTNTWFTFLLQSLILIQTSKKKKKKHFENHWLRPIHITYVDFIGIPGLSIALLILKNLYHWGQLLNHIQTKIITGSFTKNIKYVIQQIVQATIMSTLLIIQSIAMWIFRLKKLYLFREIMLVQCRFSWQFLNYFSNNFQLLYALSQPSFPQEDKKSSCIPARGWWTNIIMDLFWVDMYTNYSWHVFFFYTWYEKMHWPRY